VAVLDAGIPFGRPDHLHAVRAKLEGISRKNLLHTLIQGTSLVERKAIMVERQPLLLDELSRTSVGE
jgi:hypothetical protein